MVKITIEDILFWIIIAFIIGILIWMLSGSPTIEGALISLGGAIISSELLLWKRFYSIDKRTTIGFIKIRNDIKILEMNLNSKLDNINNKLNNKQIK